MAIYFPFPAVSAIAEELEWPCSVTRAASGDEERVSYRDKPIARYRYTCKLDDFTQIDDARRDAYNFGWHNQFIPLWHAFGDYNDWSWEYGRDAAIVDFAAVTLNDVSTSSLPSRSEAERKSCVPIRVGYFVGDIDNDAYGASGSITFAGETTETPIISGLPVQSNASTGLELFGTSPSGAVEDAVNYDRLNYVTPRGSIFVSSEQRRVRKKKKYRYTFFTPLEQRRFKEFLYRRRGRFSPFLLQDDNQGAFFTARLDSDSVTINHANNIATCELDFIEVI